MNSGMRFCPTHRPSSAASSFERRSIIRSMRELGSATRPNFSAYMSHSTSRRIALLTRRFTLTPSRSPNLRRKSSTSRSMRIVRVTLLLGGNPLLPTGDPSTSVYVKLPNALLAEDGRSFVEAKAHDDLVLRLIDLDVPLQVVVKCGPNGLLVEGRPLRAAPVLENDRAPVPFLELLVRERPPVLRQQLREAFEQRFRRDLLEPERDVFLHKVLPRPDTQLPGLVVREAIHELDQHRGGQRDEAELLAVGVPLDELTKS